MKFSYTALSSDNQKLTGVLEAENLDAAQEELHKMGLSIISINKITEEEFEKQKEEKAKEKQEGIQTFTFEAVDPAGKEINGTIDAVDDYSAYKRLIIEYKFKINALYLTGATEAEITGSKSKISEFDARMKEEGIEVTRGMKPEDDFEENKIDKEIVQETDKFIISTKKILEEYKDKFSPAFLQEIDKTLGELERIRTSNNVKHISEVCNHLYELISHPDQMPEGAETSDDVYQKILNSMKETSLIHGEAEIYKKAVGFKKIRSIFKRITNKLTGKAGDKLKLPNAKKTEKKSKAKVKAPSGPSFSNVIKNLFAYIGAPNAVLRKTRKHELSKVYQEWRQIKKKSKPAEGGEKSEPASKSVEEQIGEPVEEKAEVEPKGKDFTSFFTEVNSFVAWLLFFYIAYFFMVNFSLEKDFGLPQEFVVKTLKTPLIINITIFLLFAHLILKIKTQYFRRNFLGSLFLIFFGFGLYTLLIINF
jgi:hypothetical protein